MLRLRQEPKPILVGNLYEIPRPFLYDCLWVDTRPFSSHQSFLEIAFFGTDATKTMRRFSTHYIDSIENRVVGVALSSALVSRYNVLYGEFLTTHGIVYIETRFVIPLLQNQ